MCILAVSLEPSKYTPIHFKYDANDEGKNIISLKKTKI